MKARRDLVWLLESGELISGMETELLSIGYASSTINRYTRVAYRFYEWYNEQKLLFSSNLDEAIQLFLSHYESTCTHGIRSSRYKENHAALNQLRKFSNKRKDYPSCKKAISCCPVQTELNAFDKHLEKVCGLSLATRISRKQFVSTFLSQQFGSGPVVTDGFTPRNLMNYVSSQARGYSPGTASVMATAIRSYLKFLQFRGDIDARLVRLIPAPAKWRLADYPIVVSDSQVNSLIKSFDIKSVSGMRDHAMALCMLNMGLRAGEVAGLSLDDFDWRQSILHLYRGKSRICRELPLMNSCGSSIARYLKHGRPFSESRIVFLRHTVPVGSAIKTENVRGAMRRAYARAGFPTTWTGTHILRHTAATRMLNNGASLKEVADVLGHQSIDTTVIYTKVHTTALETVVQPWPGVLL